MNYTQILSDYIIDLQFSDLPLNTVENIKKLTLHTIGAALASIDTKQAQESIEYAEEKGGNPQATVWGSKNLKVPMEEAAFANATMADILDWEDCSWTGHPSAGAVPVAFAAVEKEHLSGKKYIEAVAAAYDVYQRIAMSVQPKSEDWGTSPNWKGWGLVCWQIYAASVAAAKALGLDKVKTASHFGVVGHQINTVGPKREESNVYHFAHGFCAKNGLNSAVIAQKGIDDYNNALDGNDGVWHQISDTVDWNWYDKELGKQYLVDETLLKHWPANMWIQAPLDALHEIYQKTPFCIEDIEKIRISPEVDLYAAPKSYPMKMLQAQFNLGYCFAAYLTDQNPGAHWFTDDKLKGGVLPDISDKIEFFGPRRNPLEQFEFFWKGSFPETTLEIKLKDGRMLSHTLQFPKGHPKNPFTWEEEISGFKKKVTCLTEKQKDQFIDSIRNLEYVEDLSELSDYLMRKE